MVLLQYRYEKAFCIICRVIQRDDDKVNSGIVNIRANYKKIVEFGAWYMYYLLTFTNIIKHLEKTFNLPISALSSAPRILPSHLPNLNDQAMCRLLFSPVPVHVLCAECVAVVDERGVDHDVLLAAVEEVLEVAEVAVAAADAVTRAVLVQDVHLTRREPTLVIRAANGLCFSNA